MSRLAIITARGGSKRIPKKNIREFCGKPILAYSIEAALSSGLFDHVMVSTDDEEIAQIAEKYGAEVPFFRSEATSGDFATTNDVLAEVLAEYEKRGMHFDIACCIYPTAPFVTAQKLTNAVEQLEASDADTLGSLWSAFPIRPREPWWWNRDGWYSNIRNIWTADPRTCSLIIMMWVSFMYSARNVLP